MGKVVSLSRAANLSTCFLRSLFNLSQPWGKSSWGPPGCGRPKLLLGPASEFPWSCQSQSPPRATSPQQTPRESASLLLSWRPRGGLGTGERGHPPRPLTGLGPRRQTVISLAGRGRAARERAGRGGGGSTGHASSPTACGSARPPRPENVWRGLPGARPGLAARWGNFLPTRPARWPVFPGAPAVWPLARSPGWLTNPGIQFKIPAAPLALRPLPVFCFCFNFHSG